jgi:hypothetical protein
MEPRQIIRAGITASAIAHLTVLMLVLFFADVHPFGSVTAETIAVDIVSPKEVAEVAEVAKQPELPPIAPEPPPIPKAPSDSLDLSARSAAAMSTPLPKQTAIQPQPPPLAASPAFVPPEPDLSVKYHVLLGLPQSRPGDGFGAPASAKADIASDFVTEFRRHLRTCSKLPGSIVASDKIKIMLRVFMAPDGKLAAQPALIEASASAKGPALMQSAIGALQACQPYTMLPSDRYGEWKVLDLSFSPLDFSGG